MQARAQIREAQGLPQQIKDAEKQLAAMKDQGQKLDDMQTELVNVVAELRKIDIQDGKLGVQQIAKLDAIKTALTREG